MQDTTKLDKRLPVLSIALHRKLKVFQFPDKTKLLRDDPFNFLTKRKDVKCNHSTQDEKLFS